MSSWYSPEVPQVSFATIDVIFLLETSWSDEMVVQVEGHIRDVFDHIVQALNRSYVIYRMLDNRIGKKNGQDWTGLIGSLYRNETDIALCPIPATIENIDVLDFTIPVLIQKWSLLSGKPLRIDTHFLATLTIFDNQIWMCLFGAIFLLPFVIAAARITTRKMFLKLANFSEIYFGYLFWAQGVLFRQSCAIESRPIAKRVALFPWILVTFLLTSSYTGVLLSKLTLPDQPRRIRKLTDLIGNPEITIYILEDTPVETLLDNPNNPQLVVLQNQLKRFKNLGMADDLLPQILAGIDKLLIGQAVAIGLEDIILQGSSYFLTDFKDDFTFYLSPVSVLDEIYSFAYRKHLDSEIKAKFDRLMMAYSRSGIIPRAILEHTFKAKQWQENFIKDNSERKEEVPLLFKSLYFAFGFWCIGLVLSLSGFIYEIWLSLRIKNASTNNVEKYFQSRRSKVSAFNSKHSNQ